MKYLFVILVNLFCSASVFASSSNWFTDLEKTYPSENYIKMIGEGATVETAKNVALGELSSYFYQKIENKSTAVKKLANNNSDFSEDSVFIQKFSSFSETELLFVQFTESFYNKKNKTYYVCAYIDKEQVSKNLLIKLNGIILEYNNVIKSVENESEILLKIRLFYEAEQKLSRFEKLYDYLLVINPKDFEELEDFLCKAKEDVQKFNQLKAKTCFSIVVEGENTKIIENILVSIISNNGMTVSKNGQYKMSVQMYWNESELNRIYFAVPQIRISIQTQEKNILTFSKTCKKLSSYDYEILQNQEFNCMEKLLKEQFAREVFTEN